eukprot:6476025-Amphidinium_carterae.3
MAPVDGSENSRSHFDCMHGVGACAAEEPNLSCGVSPVGKETLDCFWFGSSLSVLHDNMFGCFDQTRMSSQVGASEDQAGCATFAHGSRQEELERPPVLTIDPEDDLVTRLSVVSFNALSMSDRDRADIGLNRTGKLVILDSLLCGLDIDVACIQESRISCEEGLETEHFRVCVHSAVAGVGGLLVMIRKDPALQILSQKGYGARVLAVKCRLHGKHLVVVAAHAPTRDSASEDHRQFLVNLQMATNCSSSWSIIIGADLNARVREVGEDLNCVGPHSSPCHLKGKHARPLLFWCNQKGLSLLNTFHAGTHGMTTWRHPSATPDDPKESQIDFILADRMLAEKVSVCEPLPWTRLDTTTTSDHRPIVAHFVIATSKAHAVKRPLRYPVSEGHARQYQVEVRRMLATWKAPAAPLKAVQELQHLALRALRHIKPSKDVPKKPWISEGTWSVVSALRDLRCVKVRLFKGEHLSREAIWAMFATRVGADVCARFVLINSCEDAIRQQELLRDEVKLLERASQRALRNDKRKWLETQCGLIDEAWRNNKPRDAFALVKMVSKQKGRVSGRTLVDENGNMISDPEKVDQLWQKFWMEHFRAEKSLSHSFVHNQVQDPQVYEVPPECLVSRDDVLAVMKKMNHHKSSPDAAPMKLWKPIEEQLAVHMSAAFQIMQKAGSIPDSYRGSVVVPIRKRAKAAGRCDSYRPVQLLLAEAKVLSKVMLEQLVRYIVQDESQYALGPAAGLDHAHTVVTQTIAKATGDGMCLALIYIDLVAAFDQLVRQIIVLSDDPTPARKALEAVGLDDEQIAQTIAHVRSCPLALTNRDVPPCLLRLLDQWTKGSWIQLASQPVASQFSDSQQKQMQTPVTLQTSTGTRQGDNLSGCLFAIVLQLIMQEVRCLTRVMHKPVTFPKMDSRTLVSPGDMDCGVVEILDVDYADDLILPVAEWAPQDLFHATSLVLAATDKVFARYNFKLNYSTQKTQVSLNLRTGQAKSAWQAVKEYSRTVEEAGVTESKLWLPLSQGRHVQICQVYPHLGRLTSADGATKKEIAARCARANLAFSTHVGVLTSRHLSVPTRLHFFKVLVLVHLVQEVHTMPELPPAQMRKLNATYISLLKKVTRVWPRHVFDQSEEDHVAHSWWGNISDERFLELVGQPPLEDVLDARRLAYLRRAVIAPNCMLRSALAYKGRGTVWSAMLSALNNLRHKSPLAACMPYATADSFPVWADFI